MNQRTIAKQTTICGVGLHSGKPVSLCLKPACANTGIVFYRSDLGEFVPLNAFLVQDTLMSSNLVKDQVRVGTIEHLLAALAALGIDNLLIEVSAPEVPIMDGSAAVFFKKISEAGMVQLEAPKLFLKIKQTVKVSDGDKWAVFEPDEAGFLVSFEIDFEHPAIKSTPQSCQFLLSGTGFEKDIAHARTFGFLSDLAYLQANNLAQGGSLDNAIVLDDTGVVNEGGLYYPDEFVRHKILDAIGDLYAQGRAILGKFCAYKSGHALNNRLLRALLDNPDAYEVVTFYDKNDCPIDYPPAAFDPSF